MSPQAAAARAARQGVGLLRASLLDRGAFSRYGEVIAPSAASRSVMINKGTTERFDETCRVDSSAEDGSAILSIFRGSPIEAPYEISMLERHPLGSQAFVPLDRSRPYLVVVAPDDGGVPGPPEAFFVDSGVGVNYRAGVWHHPLLALGAVSEFLVVDRAGPGVNLEEIDIRPHRIVLPTVDDEARRLAPGVVPEMRPPGRSR